MFIESSRGHVFDIALLNANLDRHHSNIVD